MQPDEHINTLLAICQTDQKLKLAAWLALDAYRGRGLTIATTAGTAAEKQVLLMRSREKLRTELCDLIQPMGIDVGTWTPPPPAAPGPTQQNTPAESFDDSPEPKGAKQ